MAPKRLRSLEWLELNGCARAYVATSARARLVGLAWLDDLPEECGLLLPWCRSVHTFGMRFPLDVDFLGTNGRVVRRCRAVPPRRIVRCREAVAVLERHAR